MTALPVEASCNRGSTQRWISRLLVVASLWAGLCTRSTGAGTEAREQEHPVDGGAAFGMPLLYKFSEHFRELTKGRPGWERLASEKWPSHRTPEFYHTLVISDLHRRNLLTADDVYSLAPTNATYYVSALGAIHYTLVSLGTPPKLFLVALDTGSDLLWVPCDCQQCAAHGVNISGLEFAIYNPSNSSTSKVVACDEDICSSTLHPIACDVTTPQSCTYLQQYASANTSSSGRIVQDVILLNQESKSGALVTTNIYFGCGSLQTGDFLRDGAPNGLFGLGPLAYSVPSTLARTGVTQKVFSMCFSKSSDVGRLKFGQKPDASLQSTPLVPISPNLYYVVRVEGIVAGGVRLNISGQLVFDTGTSITSLPSTIVQAVGDAMSSKLTIKPWSYNFQSLAVLEYCWNITTNAEVDSLSSLSFIFSGGGTWEIMDPLLGFGTQGNLDFVCLGIISSDNPIIGFNFMSHYEYFFDLENATFSWGSSDCSKSNVTSTIDIAPVSAPAQAPSTSPRPPPSLPTAQAPLSPKSPGSGNPPPLFNRAHTSLPQFQLLYLTMSTVLFHLLAIKMS